MLVGIHGRNDFWGRQFTEEDFRVIRDARIEMVKLMEYTDLSVLQRLRTEHPGIDFIVRIYEGARRPDPPAEFVAQHAASIASFQPYTTKFEILNEPNHEVEGWGGEGLNVAQEFNDWLLATLRILKQQFPWAAFGFPGLAPTLIPSIPRNDLEWLGICTPSIQACDWLGVHCYWLSSDGVTSRDYGLRFTQYHERFPTKTIHITEFNDDPITNPFTRAENYARYYQAVAPYDYVASASAFLISSPDPNFQGLQWWNINSRQNEPVVAAVANIPRPLGPPISNRPEYAVDYTGHNTPAQMLTDSTTTVQVTIKNTSRQTWPETGVNMVRLGYFWFTTEGDPLPNNLWTQNRAMLPYDMAPDDTATISITLQSPRISGDYELRWDMVEEFVTWFSWEGANTLNLPVRVRRDIDPPPTGERSATASHNNVTTGVDNLLYAFDGNLFTRWSTQRNQEPGMWFQFDLGQIQTVAQVILDNSNSPQDYPRGYIVSVSQTGQAWETVAQNPNNSAPLNVVFSPRPARFIRIEQTGTSDRWWWSIHEIYVNESVTVTARSSHNNIASGDESVLQAVDGNPDTRWTTRSPQTPGQWFEVDLNESRTIQRIIIDSSPSPYNYPRGYTIRISTDRRNWTTVANEARNFRSIDVTFAPQQARFIHIEQTGTSNYWWWAIHRIAVQ